MRDCEGLDRQYAYVCRKWFVACVAIGGLSTCAPIGDGDGAYRDLGAPIGATTRFDAARFSGDWVIVERFDIVAQGGVTFSYNAPQNTMVLSGDALADHAGVYDIARTGVLEDKRNDEDPLVVMWVDEDFRTAAIGTASGDFGAILNRQIETPADRLTAAREVLDFYGWDTRKLKGRQP